MAKSPKRAHRLAPGPHCTVLAGLRVTLLYGLFGTKKKADLVASVRCEMYPVSSRRVCRRHMVTPVCTHGFMPASMIRPAAKLPLGQLQPGVAELLHQEDGDDEPRQGAVDVPFLLQGLELDRTGTS